jgi:tetratricopeptide (TPR) repeat protein
VQAEANRWQGNQAEAERCAAEAAEGFARGSVEWFRAVSEGVAACTERARSSRAVDWAEAMFASWPDQPRAEHMVAACRVAIQMTIPGRYDLFGKMLERVEHDARDHFFGDPVLSAEMNRARACWALWCTSDLGDYLARTEALIVNWEEAGDIRSACHARGDLGYGYMRVGLYGESERTLRLCLDSAQRLGLPRVAARAEHNLGLALARLTLLDEALQMEEHAVAALVALGDRRLEGAARKYVAKILTLRGDHQAAIAEAERGLACATDLPPLRAEVLATLARALLAAGRAHDALAAASEALALLERLGSLEEEEESLRLTHAETLDALARREEAALAIEESAMRIRARAEGIRDAKWRASFLGSVPEHARTLELARAWTATARAPRV